MEWYDTGAGSMVLLVLLLARATYVLVDGWFDLLATCCVFGRCMQGSLQGQEVKKEKMAKKIVGNVVLVPLEITDEVKAS